MPKHFTRARGVGLLYFIALGILLGMGAWQLARGVEKQHLERLWQTRAPAPTPLDRAPAIARGEFRNLALNGEWLRRHFLLDNRIHQNQVGYEVLTMFRPQGGGALIAVNRGWLAKTAAAPAAQQLNAGLKTGASRVRGVLYTPARGFALGEVFADRARPRVMQFFDAQAIAEKLQTPVAPHLLIQDAPEFARLGAPFARITPARHFAYAMQWWALAAVLAVFGFIWRRQQANPERRPA